MNMIILAFLVAVATASPQYNYGARPPTHNAPVQAPASTYNAPVQAPVSTYNAPVQAPAPTYNTPVQAPAPTYNAPAPAPTYNAPVQAPAPTYNAPVQAPAPTYNTPVQAPAPTYNAPVQAPAPTYNAPLEAAATSQPYGARRAPVRILRDERQGPDATGAYSFILESADGTTRQEQGTPHGPTGAVATQGGWSFTFPDGTPAAFTFVADGAGYRVESPLLPTPPPLPAHAIAQIEKARQEDAVAAGGNRYAAPALSNQYASPAPAPAPVPAPQRSYLSPQ